MSDRILQRYTRTEQDESQTPPDEELAVDDCGAFGWLRGAKDRALMLELRLRNGNSVAFDYGWLRKVEFNPSEGVVLHFGDSTVKLIGRNLNRPLRPGLHLLRGLFSHRIPWIQEASEPDLMQAPDTATIIEQITLPSGSR